MIELNLNSSKSNADIVADTLNEIYGIKGEAMNEHTLAYFQYKLEYLLGYVTLISTDILLILDNFEGKVKENIVYFFDDDVIQLLILKLKIDNNYHKDYNEKMFTKYQYDCCYDNKCLVYKFDEKSDEWVVNLEMSDEKRLPAIFSKINLDFETIEL